MFSTKSNNRYSNGGRVKIEKTESLRPLVTPDWVNFKGPSLYSVGRVTFYPTDLPD
ncbi:hypothetical protein PBN151_3640 [Paenibacillus sp. NAIST15-1]|nr:hypothetical protein PBN151_3640 [Paenibacillus sp. NAIST15-1]